MCRSRAPLVVVALLAPLAVACASRHGALAPPSPAPVSFTTQLGAASPLVGRVFDVATRSEIGWEAMLDALSRARFALVGERHDQPDHHALQARVVTDLAARGARPAVALEMLHAGQAEALARAQAGGGTRARAEALPAGDARAPAVARSTATGETAARADAVADAVGWERSGWPAFALYRPIFEAALGAGLPLVAANAPPERVRAIARGRADPEAKALLARAAPLRAAGRAELAAEIQRGHCGHAPEAMIGAMVDAQRVRDAAMAEALVAAAGARDASSDSGPAALLIAGNGHVSRHSGVPLQLEALLPGARVASVALLEVQDDVADPFAPGADPELVLSGFDYVVFTPRLDDDDPCETYRRQLERMRKPPPAPRSDAGAAIFETGSIL